MWPRAIAEGSTTCSTIWASRHPRRYGTVGVPRAPTFRACGGVALDVKGAAKQLEDLVLVAGAVGPDREAVVVRGEMAAGAGERIRVGAGEGPDFRTPGKGPGFGGARGPGPGGGEKLSIALDADVAKAAARSA